MIMIPGTPTAPRELVLASAGTGKTFRISSRILGLLAAGSRPDAIFASTFTRKAAGEILDRVLARLAAAALDPAEAVALAEHALPAAAALDAGAFDPALPDAWLHLLRRVVADLHRLNIGTLDAFFVRAATSFADEIDLPPGWTIADRPTADQVRADALRSVLRNVDAGEMLELVRALDGRDASRSVHRTLLARIERLLTIHHALDPAATGVWSSFDSLATLTPPELARRAARLADDLAATDPPLNKSGAPRSIWVKALAALASAARAGDWGAFLKETLCVNAQQEEPKFDRTEIPDTVLVLIGEGRTLAREAFAARFALQSRAMGRLIEHVAGTVESTQRALGAYDFGDVTRLVGGQDGVCNRPDLFYRLDGRIRHVLLDEFQDTSLAQWNALQPLLDGLLDRAAADGAAVIVADPKQSIYGWRGGEPLLVSHVGDRYHLDRDELSKSWRSSPIVLDLVNRIFGDIEANPVCADGAGEVALEWKQSFATHTAAYPALPGYVQLLVGPKDEGKDQKRPLLCRRAAELVAEIHAAAPGRSIGVLVRRNATVARLMLELRELGVPASEEGGNPLTDSPAVAAVVSLLRMADHPGDLIARYHVVQTPLGAVIGLSDHRDAAEACRVAHGLRERLLDIGYGATLRDLVKQLLADCEPRDARRLAQLVELGFRYDARATLRTTDFIRLVETERVEDPTAADVRVMTVHQAKGLEFDAVVLPELDLSLAGSRSEDLGYRPAPAARVTRAFPYVNEEVRALFPDLPELQGAASQAAAARWRDALSGLYVALTRARHAVYIVVKPDGAKGIGQARSSARLVRHALEADAPASEGDLLFENGDPRWFDRKPAAAAAVVLDEPKEESALEPIRLRATSTGERALARVSPSGLAAETLVNLRSVLRLDRQATDRGTLAHAWFERIVWVEDGVPSDAELREIARFTAPDLDAAAVELLRLHFRGWLALPAIHNLLTRGAYPAGATVERESHFLRRSDGRLMEGIIDRLVLLRENGRVVGAEILDYKTDALPAGDPAALAARAGQYRTQLEAYRDAVSAWYSLPAAAVKARLVFLASATILDV
jgi:ATP-dependent exoDNAse (exonuclease V) beta subunit